VLIIDIQLIKYNKKAQNQA